MKETGWQITIHWVKAHAGTRGNELADRLAKRAALNETILTLLGNGHQKPA
jgi:ribonuclease HI